MGADGGLDAAEIALVAAELGGALRGSLVRDAGVTAPFDDLFLVLDGPRGREVLLVAAIGPGRSRIAITNARFAKTRMESGGRVEALRAALCGATLERVACVAGDRRVALELAGTPAGRTRVVAELFGRAGNWLLLDAGDTVLALARAVSGKSRTLAVGAPYEPPHSLEQPAPRSAPEHGDGAEGSGRFGPPAPGTLAVSERIDRFFTHVDRGLVLEEELARVRERLHAAQRRARDRATGLAAAAAEVANADRIRHDADLLLGNLAQLRRGMTEVTLEDWFGEGNPPRTIALVDKLDGRRNAEALYERARRLADSAEVTERLRAEAEERLRSLAALEESLAQVGSIEDLDALAPAIAAAGLRAKQRQPPPARRGTREKPDGAADFRTFTSAEGYQILVGKSASGNEAVTKRMARGNDVWMHIGGGVAGSHVVVRLPREKTASLETLLDAAHLAVHFSKARGRPACEVVYTQRKHVRKPKGFAKGQVSLDRSKTIFVRTDADRLQRVLDTASQRDEDLPGPAGAARQPRPR